MRTPHIPDDAEPCDDWDLVLGDADASAPEQGAAAVLVQKEPSEAASAEPLPRPPAPRVLSAPVALANRAKLDYFPGFVARSGLFGIGGRDVHPPHAGPIPAQGPYALNYSGARLSMRDKAVWEVLMAIAKGLPDICAEVEVFPSDIARRMGWSDTSGSTLDWIWASIERLALSQVEVLLLDESVHSGGLVGSARKEGTKRFVSFETPLLGPIFAKDRQFRIAARRRRELDTALARWLHDFFSTHKAFKDPLTLSYIRDLCGYDGEKRRFPKQLERALDELVAKVPGLVQCYQFSKSGKASDTWELVVERGDERPAFTMPKGIASRRAPSEASRAKPVRAARPSL